ncbi:phenoloxidase-activating factor 2-like [Uranotaenia lowii]|uniref:phenoloxidase-activating factor 2-like n=1 Tax=Uranotaenia lowii TaxID=190385 RepID=UPI0024783C93|nr:phenoloxidase-activating factor 2-like [Uranotaenia lowii]
MPTHQVSLRILTAVLIVGQGLLLGSLPLVAGQLDGSFWWTNTDLIKKVEQLRDEKDVKAVVVNNETEIDSVRLRENTNVAEDTFVDTPDCFCVPNEQCRSISTGRDGLCGIGKTCCRRNYIIQTTSPKPLVPVSLQDITISSANQSPPDAAILLEITALLEELNGSNAQLEPEAEFVFPTEQPRVPTSKPITTTTSTQKPRQPTPVIPVPVKPKKCGQRRDSIGGRVLFQDENEESLENHLTGTVGFGEFPWTVYVEERLGNGSFLYKCGGALVTSNVVITAGHCVANARNDPLNFQIVAGDWDRRHEQEKVANQRRTVSRVILHPNYYSGSLYNDIAVLILTQHINDRLPNVGNVCLPTVQQRFTEVDKCFLTGWGASPTSANQEEPIQRFTAMPLVRKQECEVRLQRSAALGQRFRMHDSFLCAGGQPGLDSCKGSGGSPLVCESEGAYVLAGIMSWGVSCGTGVPVVFSNVIYQTGWIRNVIDGLEDNVVYFV